MNNFEKLKKLIVRALLVCYYLGLDVLYGKCCSGMYCTFGEITKWSVAASGGFIIDSLEWDRDDKSIGLVRVIFVMKKGVSKMSVPKG